MGALALMLTAATSACGCPRPFTETFWDCKTSGDVTISAPASYNINCPPNLRWGGDKEDTGLTMTKGCDTDDYVWIRAFTQPNLSPGTYTTAAGTLFVDGFSCYTASAYSCPWIREIRGQMIVEKTSSSGAEATVDILFVMTAGEEIAVKGHVSASRCYTTRNTSCSD